MKNTLKLASLALAAVVAVGMTSVSASAVTFYSEEPETETETQIGLIDFGTCGEDLCYTLSENGELFIYGLGDMNNYTLVHFQTE